MSPVPTTEEEMSHSRLAIGNLELSQLAPEDFRWMRLNPSYLTRLIYHANLLGLEGRKIMEMIEVKEQFSTGQQYIDFLCEP